MKINNFSEVILTKAELFDALYRGTVLNNSEIYLDNADEVARYNASIDRNADKIGKIKTQDTIPVLSTLEYDSINQHKWFIPQHYKEFPILEWLLSQCSCADQQSRVKEEFVLFEKHNMVNVLLYLKFLVDTMRNHKIIWGVGRGSSVASYILFLIGVHKIDSIKFNLDIREFLR